VHSTHLNIVKHGRGFTLLEVLAAVAILAMAILSLYSLQNQSIELSSYVNEMTIATLMTKGRIAELELKARYPNFAILRKALTDDYPGFELEDLSEEEAGATLQLPEGIKPKALGVRVKWKRRGNEESMKLTTFVPPQ